MLLISLLVSGALLLWWNVSFWAPDPPVVSDVRETEFTGLGFLGLGAYVFLGGPLTVAWLGVTLSAILTKIFPSFGRRDPNPNALDPLEHAAMSEAILSGSFRSMNTVRYMIERRRNSP